MIPFESLLHQILKRIGKRQQQQTAEAQKRRNAKKKLKKIGSYVLYKVGRPALKVQTPEKDGKTFATAIKEKRGE